MEPPTDMLSFKAKIKLRETQDGGRLEPTPPATFYTILEHKSGNFSCRLFFGNDERLTPGQIHTVSVVLLFQEFYKNFAVGDDIGIFDGKNIATGNILSLQ